jgi:hypothetical protein
VLELGRTSDKSNQEAKGVVEEVVHFLDLLFTLGRICLGNADLDSGKLALQKGALYVDRLKTLHGSDAAGRRRLEAGHVVLRMAISWRKGKLDVAEHLFAKSKDLIANLEPTSAENMADALRHIGADLSGKKDLAMGTKCLWRAYSVINTGSLDHVSVDGLDCRLAICQSLVSSLLGMDTAEATVETNDLWRTSSLRLGTSPLSCTGD